MPGQASCCLACAFLTLLSSPRPLCCSFGFNRRVKHKPSAAEPQPEQPAEQPPQQQQAAEGVQPMEVEGAPVAADKPAAAEQTAAAPPLSPSKEGPCVMGDQVCVCSGAGPWEGVAGLGQRARLRPAPLCHPCCFRGVAGRSALGWHLLHPALSCFVLSTF